MLVSQATLFNFSLSGTILVPLVSVVLSGAHQEFSRLWKQAGTLLGFTQVMELQQSSF